MQSLHAFRSALLLQRCQQLQATANRMDSARDNRVRLRVIPGPKRGSARAGQVSLPFSVAGCLVVIELKIRSEEHTSELQSLMRISYAVFCLKKKKTTKTIILKTRHTHIKMT